MKLFFIILISISITATAQKKDTVLTDSTKFLSLADINRLSAKYKDVATYNEYTHFLNIMNAILKEAILEWKTKNKISSN
jgi:hypothetical protein